MFIELVYMTWVCITDAQEIQFPIAQIFVEVLLLVHVHFPVGKVFGFKLPNSASVWPLLYLENMRVTRNEQTPPSICFEAPVWG